MKSLLQCKISLRNAQDALGKACGDYAIYADPAAEIALRVACGRLTVARETLVVKESEVLI